jgi:hypothetical protein
VSTEKKIDANRLNSTHSTGPKTASGKAASARNAMKHGMTAKKYLTPSESAEEFEAVYAARRKLYAPDDTILDRLIRQITLADFRVDRGFEAEATVLQQGSLAEVLVQYDKPIKHLSGYEANNRRMRKQLEEELTRYLSMRNEADNAAGDEKPEPPPHEPKDPFPTKKGSAQPDAVVKAPASDAAAVSPPAAATAAASRDASTTTASSGSAPPEPGSFIDKRRKTKAAASAGPDADVSAGRHHRLKLLPLFDHAELSVQAPPLPSAAMGVHKTRGSTSCPSAPTPVPASGSAPQPDPVLREVRKTNPTARKGTITPISPPAAMPGAPEAALPSDTTLQEDHKTGPMLPSGGQAPISPPAETRLSRSSASSIGTAPGAPMSSNPTSGENLKTKPRATGEGTTPISSPTAMPIAPALPPPPTTPISPAAEIPVSRSSASSIVTAPGSRNPTSGENLKTKPRAASEGKTPISPPPAMPMSGSSASSTLNAPGSAQPPTPTSVETDKTNPIASSGSQTPISPLAAPPPIVPSPPGPPPRSTPPRRWPLTHDLVWNPAPIIRAR